ncbi:MAG: LysM peptidoglycan-binding domain-containing protein [Bacteroidales bacterium]|nr:LysM peptidoglycan-binding domain-containing protein [Bacteroidales bacterium]
MDTARNDPKFIHASNHGVRYSSIYTESYYANRLLGARRILPDFEDYKVEFDSTATYAFEPDHGVHIAPDSLVLADNDRRIVLFENGKWAYIDADGALSIPEGSGRLILTGDGNWAPVRETKVTIPTSALKPDPRDLEPEPKPATTAKAQPAPKPAATPKDTSATAAAPQGEQIYHTIVKGDSLSKIARQHGTTVNKLCQLNNISANTVLRVGRKLRVK